MTFEQLEADEQKMFDSIIQAAFTPDGPLQ